MWQVIMDYTNVGDSYVCHYVQSFSDAEIALNHMAAYINTFPIQILRMEVRKY